MALVAPPTDKSLGNKVVVFVTTPPAAATGIPTLTEVNAAIFAQLHIYTPFNVTPTQNTGEGPRKVGSRAAPTELGQVTFEAVETQYSYKPQELGAPGAEGNELYEALTPNSLVTAVVLPGLDGELDTLEAGAVADIYLMRCGRRAKGETGDGEFDHLSVTQQLIVEGGEPLAEDHALAGV